LRADLPDPSAHASQHAKYLPKYAPFFAKTIELLEKSCYNSAH